MGNFSCVVIDFETTGLSPGCGDRTIEVGAVLVENNIIVATYQSLMNPGMRISGFIEDYTGITNKMLSTAPPVNTVMDELANFIVDHPLVAHNASFDSRFLDNEFLRSNKKRTQPFACSMLISRRIFPEAPGHSLESLVKYKNLRTTGIHHRALADAEMTAYLWIEMINDLKARYDLREIPFELMFLLAKIPRKKVSAFIQKYS
jgi:DNA polymerase-3 subunit epsilon